ncbi:MAG: ABC transporter ATP-binding protein, partial [Eubacteriales bacterium]|nr:ABC transporter ATP-binding protein [Eubacteriales bacterium]
MSQKMNPQMGKEKVDKATVKRLFSYILNYKWKFIVVFITIILSSTVSSISGKAIGIFIDNYITPLIGVEEPIFTDILNFIIVLGIIYLIGVISAFIYSRLMVSISQGVLKKIRDDMFAHMQKLPIRYFDTNSTGDIMSHYTNDTDTLRQVLSQSIPQAFAALVTIITVFFTMLFTSFYLTILVILTLFFMLFCVKNIAQ